MEKFYHEKLSMDRKDEIVDYINEYINSLDNEVIKKH